MKLHRNAKSTPSSRLLLVRRVLFEEWSRSAAAEAAGVSERTVAKWVRRFRQAGLDPADFERTSEEQSYRGKVAVLRHRPTGAYTDFSIQCCRQRRRILGQLVASSQRA